MNENKFDKAVANFSIHYMTQTREGFEMYMHNILYNLKVGGLFVGTILDAEEVSRYMRRDKRVSFRINDKWFYRIEGDATYSSSDTYEEFWKNNRNTIQISRPDWNEPIPELMLSSKDLDLLLTKFGLRRVKVKSFERIYNNSKKSRMSNGEKDISFMHDAFIYIKE